MPVQRVLMVSPEYYGYAMAGCLGMAVTGLSKALVKQGIDVRVIVPQYPDTKDPTDTDVTKKYKKRFFRMSSASFCYVYWNRNCCPSHLPN